MQVLARLFREVVGKLRQTTQKKGAVSKITNVILEAAKQQIQQAVVSACTLLTVCKDSSCNPLWIAATETRAPVNLFRLGYLIHTCSSAVNTFGAEGR